MDTCRKLVVYVKENDRQIIHAKSDMVHSRGLHQFAEMNPHLNHGEVGVKITSCFFFL